MQKWYPFLSPSLCRQHKRRYNPTDGALITETYCKHSTGLKKITVCNVFPKRWYQQLRSKYMFVLSYVTQAMSCASYLTNKASITISCVFLGLLRIFFQMRHVRRGSTHSRCMDYIFIAAKSTWTREILVCTDSFKAYSLLSMFYLAPFLLNTFFQSLYSRHVAILQNQMWMKTKLSIQQWYTTVISEDI